MGNIGKIVKIVESLPFTESPQQTPRTEGSNLAVQGEADHDC